MIYAQPGTENAVVNFKSHYDNYIGGEWVKPVAGNYFDNSSPVNGENFCKVARSSAADIELALDAAHAAKSSWAKTSVTERANILLKIADRIEENIEELAVAETWETANQYVRL
ncbi:aldehyde dehydrogenase [Vibrio ponticus]|nr:aldehyde dehydrogenase [Vibrio ponticus]